MFAASVSTPFGPLCLHEEEGRVARVTWEAVDISVDTPLLRMALQQLAEYCSGARTAFDLPLRLSGAPLTQAVCAEMQRIPFGQTRTYGEIARAVGASAQAVGQACGQNPLPVLIPCHRVMGAGGKLVGFSGAGGVDTKVALLRHEGAASLLI
jgi:methylated-DNA-[protein]-cysteine S-methyltransferase